MPGPTLCPKHYLSGDALAVLVRDSRQSGRASEGLARALIGLARGVWDRYRFTPERDDFVQAVVIHLLGRPLEKVDEDKHPFNYFTTCAIRYGLKLRNRLAADRRRFETYAAELVEAGRPIPDRDSE